MSQKLVLQVCSICLGLCVQAGSLEAFQVEADFYHFGAQRVPVSIHLDSIGILPKRGRDEDALILAMNARGLDFARPMPEGLLMFEAPPGLSRTDIFRLASVIENEDTTVVAKAGPLVTVDSPVRLVAVNQVIVRFHPNATPAQIDSLNAVYGVVPVAQTPFVPNEFLLQLTSASPGDVIQMAQAYHAEPLTQSAFVNFFGGTGPTGMGPGDPLSVNQWHLEKIRAFDAWAISPGNSNTIIAVIEAGGYDVTDPPDAGTHPDIVDNLISPPGVNFGNCSMTAGNAALSVTDLTPVLAQGGCALSDISVDPGDSDQDRRHGTAVAGTVAAVGSNRIGGAGVCPACGLLLIRTGPSDYAKKLALIYADFRGADVINASWKAFASDPIAPDVQATVSKGIPVVFSMGNSDFFKCGPPPADAGIMRIVGVGEGIGIIAVGGSSEMDQRLPSGKGWCLDVLAPGDNIVTTDHRSFGYDSQTQNFPACSQSIVDPGYTACFGGSSAAVPVVSGIIGLMLSVNPDLTPEEIETILHETAVRIEEDDGDPGTPSGVVYNDPGFDGVPVAGLSWTHGFGRVDAWCAVRAAAAPDEECGEPPPPNNCEGPMLTDDSNDCLSGTEIGTRVGFTFLDGSTDQSVAGVPGGGPMADAVLHLTSWQDPWMFDLQFGISNTENSGTTPDTRIVVAALQPAIMFGDFYVGPSFAVRRVEIQGTPTTNIGAWGAAVGYRLFPLPFAATRIEARFRRWPSISTNEWGLAFAFGVFWQ